MNANNIVSLVGRLTREPEIRYNQNQTAVCRLTLAVDRMDKEKNADFINCVAFGKTAELLGRYTDKGSRIVVNGNIRTGSYEKQDGTKVYTTDVYIDSLSIIDFKDSGRGVMQKKEQENEDFVPTSDDEDLPF